MVEKVFEPFEIFCKNKAKFFLTEFFWDASDIPCACWANG